MLGVVAALIVWSALVFVYAVYSQRGARTFTCLIPPAVAGQPQPTIVPLAEQGEYWREHCAPSPYEPWIFLGVGYVVIVGVAITQARSK
jgi:hypothetical protein